MKARYPLLVSGLFLLAVGGGLFLRHQIPAKTTFLQEQVQPSDIEAAVTAMGALDLSGGVVRAAISETDINKVGIGKEVYFTRVGVLDQHYSGRVISMTAMPASFVAAAPAIDQKAAQDNGPEIADDAEDPDAIQAAEIVKQTTAAKAKDQPRAGVFYNVVFRIDDPSQLPRVPSVMVHVVQGVVKQAPSISRLALQAQLAENRYRVEVVDKNGRLTPREITTGLTDDLLVEIKSGLVLGDVVAIKDDASLYEPGYRS